LKRQSRYLNKPLSRLRWSVLRVFARTVASSRLPNFRLSREYTFNSHRFWTACTLLCRHT
jgi:hypothetical protein